MPMPECCSNAEYSAGIYHDFDCAGGRPLAPMEAEIYRPILVVNRDKFHVADTCRLDQWSKFEGEVHIGEFVHVASFCHLGIGGGVLWLEDYSACASGTKIITGSNLPDGLTMSAKAPQEMQRRSRSMVRLERYATTLTNSVVLPGVTLHEGAVLAAGGVATKDIPAWEIWGGVPARKMGDRKVTNGA